MGRLITQFISICIVASFMNAAPADAAHESPLYQAATEYREAVRHFERLVIRSRDLRRYHKRVADDLEDATSRFRNAARRAHDPDRLVNRWQEIQRLQQRVEVEIIANPNCPSAIELDDCWYRVLVAYQQVAYEMSCCGLNPVHHQPSVHVQPPVDRALPVDSAVPASGPSIIEPVVPTEPPLGGSSADNLPTTQI